MNTNRRTRTNIFRNWQPKMVYLQKTFSSPWLLETNHWPKHWFQSKPDSSNPSLHLTFVWQNAFPSKGPTPRFLHVSGSPAYDHLFHKRLGHGCAVVGASNGLAWQWSWKVSQSQSWTWNLKIYGLSHVRDPLFQCAILRFWSFNTVLPFAVCTCGEKN